MEIVLVGLNHLTAPVEVRERVSFTNEQARRADPFLDSWFGSDAQERIGALVAKLRRN